MKIPLKWLGEYVGMNLTAAQLVERLTLAGLEVGGIRVFGLAIPEGLRVKPEDVGPVWDRDKVIVGKVMEVERHPNADRLTLCTIDYGAQQPRTVVTGAPNIHVGDKGQKVILALAGAVLYDGHADKKVLKELKPGVIRGKPSDAMVCSAYELGISDEHAGIILLEPDAPVGKPLADYMGDVVLELDVLPNMARCLSLIGVAREVAALTGQELRRPKTASEMYAEPIGAQVKVVIDNPKLCPRYSASVIKEVKIGSSPGWMARRLTYAGMRPINNIVDITNYVMLEWGQPLHAFDLDVLKRRAGDQPPTIVVRSAKEGETLKTLDGVERKLAPRHLVIADAAGPIALAGVMGGAETEVSEQTTNVLLESASFDAVSVRLTAREFNVPSEASARFSRGVHPEIVKPASERAAELMRLHAAGRVSRGVVESYPAPLPVQQVSLELEEIRQVLGIKKFPQSEAVRILRALEFEVEASAPDSLLVKVPPHRLDIQAGSADLIEELARIHGYDKLPATLLADELPEQHANLPLLLEERVRDILVTAGLQEVITYSLTMPEREAPLDLAETPYVRLKNPISAERVALRHSVLASVLEVTAANLRHGADARLFEIGQVYLPKAGQKLPDEPRRLAFVLTGRRHPDFWKAVPADNALDFFDLKGIVETLAADLHLPEVTYQPSKASYLHPGRAANLVIQGKPVGGFGELHPRLPGKFVAVDDLFKPLVGHTLLVGELDLEAILAAVPERYAYGALSPFPPALRDVAVIVPQATPAYSVVTEIRAAGADLLRGVRLFDHYKGDSIPAGTKSLAYALTYQAADRTLTDKEVDKAHKKIEERLKQVLKAQIRGQ